MTRWSSACLTLMSAADAVTASPYLGFGSLQPLVDTARKHDAGLFVLALTSNKEGPEVQHATTDDGRTVAGTFQQGPAQFPLTFGRTAPAAPATPAGPPPYRVEDVTYRNGDVTLAATFTIPQGKGPFPAVVMATGSGSQNRDEELFGFKVFGVIADYLTRHGVAAR